MATDEDGDVIMDAPAAEAKVPAAKSENEKTTTETKDDESEEKPAEVEIPLEERVTKAEYAKTVGNELLKQGNLAEAVVKYAEGIELTEKLLEKDPAEEDADMHKRAVAVYQALRLNSAQACLKQQAWADASEHADKVLLLDKDNSKALYRRAMAGINFDSEGRLEQARADLARVAQLEPSNREAREHLTKTKERLKEMRQLEKERYAKALQGGDMYQEQHEKLNRQQLMYEEEVKRRKEADEAEITFEDWQKKQKEKEDEEKKKEKEAREKQIEEARKAREQSELDEENSRRATQGLEALSLDAWNEEKRNACNKKEDVLRTDEIELDEEEKKMLEEQKKRGYYHGRLGTVLSDAAPKPQQVEAQEEKNSSPEPAKRAGVSEWNQAGTWEEKECTTWAKEEMTKWLKNASVSSPSSVSSADGKAFNVLAKVYAVKTLNGDAQIVVVRRQPRHGFAMDAELSFSVAFTPVEESETEKTVTFKGKFILPELADFVAIADLRVDISWKGDRPSTRFQPLATEWVEKLRDNVRNQVASFVEEYKKK